MKKCTFLTFLFYLFFMSTNLLASDPNFDTVRGMIYTFPRVTVDNSSAYLNVQVQLNPNGTWSVLNATEEDSETSSIHLSGNWKGRAYSSYYPCNTELNISMSQTGTSIIGSGSSIGDCTSVSGSLTAEINGNNISFGLYIADMVSEIRFTGTISADQQSMSGTYSWPDEYDQGTWTLDLQ